MSVKSYQAINNFLKLVHNYPHGDVHFASILSHNKINGLAINDKFKRPTHCSVHAEVMALQKYYITRKSDEIVDIIVVRINNLRELRNSHPCVDCIHALSTAKVTIRNVYYSTSNDEIICVKFNYMVSHGDKYVTKGRRNKK